MSRKRDLLAVDAVTAATVRDGVELQVRAGLRVRDGGGVVARASATDEAPATVERDSANASAYGSVGGTGEVIIETG